MSREKIKVPSNVYDELVALEREIHFTLDTKDTVKRAEDRGYMAAANWIRENENAYKVGFSWGFESEAGESRSSTLQDIPTREEPVQRRTVAHPPPVQATRPQPREIRPPQRKSSQSSSGSNQGILAGIKKWIDKYF
jgi:hypothetical protein